MAKKNYHRQGEPVGLNEYYQAPKSIFGQNYKQYSEKELGLKARVILMDMIDLFRQSAVNGWQDEKGETFIHYSRKRAMDTFGWADKTVSKAFEQLIECGFIAEKTEDTKGFIDKNVIYLDIEKIMNPVK